MTVDTRTGELLDAPSYGEVRESIESAKSSLEAAAEQIVWQVENRVWLVLGYGDWNEMREAEYGGAAFMVPRAERPELLARMRTSGLTYREIADTAGVSDETVRRDLETTNVVSPSITNARGQQRPASYTRTPAPASSGEVEPARVNPSQGEELDALSAAGSVVGARPHIEDPRPAKPTLVPPPADEFTEQDRAEELASNLAAHLSLLYAVTNPERRAEYIATWRLGTDHRPVLGQKYVAPDYMRAIADALHAFANEWEHAHV